MSLGTILTGILDACQVLSPARCDATVQGMSAESAPSAGRRSRGDRQREAIVTAVRELLEERSFEELSVSAISERAGITRSGFYFYFESKYDVLALIFDEATQELEELTHYFAPRGAHETPAAFAKRMVGSAAAVYAHNDPIMAACLEARNTDAKIREILDRQIDTGIEQILKVFEDETAPS